MTVKELIEKLQKYPPELEVLYSDAKHLRYHVGGLDNDMIIDDDNGNPVLIIGDF